MARLRGTIGKQYSDPLIRLALPPIYACVVSADGTGEHYDHDVAADPE
jgi:hypothetical protein